jgi:hypothetical protein
MTDYTRYPTDILPLPQLSGHGYKRNSGTERIQMASGRTRNRRKWFHAPATTSLRWVFSSAEAELFEGWVLDVLEGGAVTFVIPIKTPAGHIDHTCSFISDYDLKCKGPTVWECSVNVEIEELVLLQGDVAKGVIDIGATLDDLGDLIDDIETNINE